jgi:hypothetical protein
MSARVAARRPLGRIRGQKVVTGNEAAQLPPRSWPSQLWDQFTDGSDLWPYETLQNRENEFWVYDAPWNSALKQQLDQAVQQQNNLINAEKQWLKEQQP